EQRGEARAQRPQPRPTGSSAQSLHTRRATSTATSDDSSTTPPSIQARSATVPAGRLSYSMRPRFTAPSQAPRPLFSTLTKAAGSLVSHGERGGGPDFAPHRDRREKGRSPF